MMRPVSTRPELKLAGQSAIVTGGTRGIGAAISRALLEAEVRVAAIYGRDDAAAQAWAKQLGNPSGQLSLHRLDISDYAAVERFFSGFSEPLHILVNCAAIRHDALFGLMDKDAWSRVIDVDLSGAFNVCRFAVRAMLGERYGRIVNLTSPSARISLAGQSNYAAAKAGVVAMTRTIALEMAGRGITANCVCPGLVQTDLIRDLPEDRLEALRASVPMKRFGTPDEIAAAVMFLVSPAASYVTGAMLDVTGGI
jgi:3-oxoacyl-[acyl-carrier protein] reductase